MESTANYKKVSVKVFINFEDMARAFFDLIAEEILASMSLKQNYHLCLSGGSTPLKMFEYLKSLPLNKMKWNYFHVFWGDERCVPPDHPDSNYGNAHKTILEFMRIPEANIHRIKGESDPEEESLRYENVLRNFLPKYSETPCFDMMILGLGEDGHTASIFPGQKSIIDTERLVLPSVNSNNGQKRITLTPKIINNSKNILFIVTGSSKAEVVSKIINRSDDYKSFPATIVDPVNGYLSWYLDIESAKFIENKI